MCGVTIRIYTIADMEQADQFPTTARELKENELYYWPGNWGEAVQAAGYPVNKVDFALPHGFILEHQKENDGKMPEAVWYYPEGSIFGEPLWKKDILEKLDRMLLKVLSMLDENETRPEGN